MYMYALTYVLCKNIKAKTTTPRTWNVTYCLSSVRFVVTAVLLHFFHNISYNTICTKILIPCIICVH